METIAALLPFSSSAFLFLSVTNAAEEVEERGGGEALGLELGTDRLEPAAEGEAETETETPGLGERDGTTEDAAEEEEGSFSIGDAEGLEGLGERWWCGGARVEPVAVAGVPAALPSFGCERATLSALSFAAAGVGLGLFSPSTAFVSAVAGDGEAGLGDAVATAA